MVFILGSSVTFEQFDGTAYSKELVDTSSMSEAELHAIVTLLRQGSVSTVDVNGSKLYGANKVISAQSNLVDYERTVRSSQFIDGEDVNGGQLSSFTLPSQQSSCSMPWMHALEKSLCSLWKTRVCHPHLQGAASRWPLLETKLL